ncbi:MAG: hypothetical protein LBL01_05535 [Bifidobacteriaceae bacterium]|jgi:hypothetical protein|nr:hypothetical protein [Bifidobacteriaceae bacterium]
MIPTRARKTLATLATAALAATGLALVAQPAAATDGDLLQLGYLQATPTSGVIDPVDHVGWLTNLSTNEGDICPVGFRARSGLYAVVDGVVNMSAVGGVMRAGSSYDLGVSHGGINDGETSINRVGERISIIEHYIPWVSPRDEVVELRHTCHAAAPYSETTDPYYSIRIKIEADGSWEVLPQSGPSEYDSSESDINVTVPEATTTTPPTGLKISVKPGPVTLTGPGTREAGQVWSATGTLDDVTVNDDRRNAALAGWTLNGKASAFTAGADTISSENLGWTPAKVSGAGTAGGAVAPGANGGLSTDKQLAAGTASATANVETTVNAALRLDVPASAADGAYKSTLTLTLI